MTPILQKRPQRVKGQRTKSPRRVAAWGVVEVTGWSAEWWALLDIKMDCYCGQRLNKNKPPTNIISEKPQKTRNLIITPPFYKSEYAIKAKTPIKTIPPPIMNTDGNFPLITKFSKSRS
jgi:hypothetical protein